MKTVSYKIRSDSFESSWFTVPEDSPFIAVELAEQKAYQFMDSGELTVGERVTAIIECDGYEIGVILGEND